jgi:hypothetical protein
VLNLFRLIVEGHTLIVFSVVSEGFATGGVTVHFVPQFTLPLHHGLC